MMAFRAYMLRCSDGRDDTGQPDDPDRRLSEHRHGGVCDFTSRRRPVGLARPETFPTGVEALEAERRVGGCAPAKTQPPVAGDWRRISANVRPPRERLPASLETNDSSAERAIP